MYGWEFSGILIFVNSENGLRINFHAYNFVDSNPLQGYGTAQTMIKSIHSQSHSIHFITARAALICKETLTISMG